MRFTSQNILSALMLCSLHAWRMLLLLLNTLHFCERHFLNGSCTCRSQVGCGLASCRKYTPVAVNVCICTMRPVCAGGNGSQGCLWYLQFMRRQFMIRRSDPVGRTVLRSLKIANWDLVADADSFHVLVIFLQANAAVVQWKLPMT